MRVSSLCWSFGKLVGKAGVPLPADGKEEEEVRMRRREKNGVMKVSEEIFRSRTSIVGG